MAVKLSQVKIKRTFNGPNFRDDVEFTLEADSELSNEVNYSNAGDEVERLSGISQRRYEYNFSKNVVLAHMSGETKISDFEAQSDIVHSFENDFPDLSEKIGSQIDSFLQAKPQ